MSLCPKPSIYWFLTGALLGLTYIQDRKDEESTAPSCQNKTATRTQPQELSLIYLPLSVSIESVSHRSTALHSSAYSYCLYMVYILSTSQPQEQSSMHQVLGISMCEVGGRWTSSPCSPPLYSKRPRRTLLYTAAKTWFMDNKQEPPSPQPSIHPPVLISGG